MEKKRSKLSLIKLIKNYFINDKRNYKLFFTTYSKGIGYFFIHYFSNTKIGFFRSINIIFKDIFYSSYYKDISLIENNKKCNYENIIVTWAFKKNFSNDGSFYDPILNTNSKDLKKTLWFLIYLDSKLPKKISNSCVILRPFKNKKINFYFLIKNILQNTFQRFHSIVFNLNLFSSFSIFANEAGKIFNRYLKKNIKIVFMPYEAQPFQHNFFLKAKKFSKKIKTVGYLHSPPEAFPVQSIYKIGSPEKLIVNGSDQVYCYKKFLGWNKRKILNLPSIRFLKRKKNIKINNKIFLPFSILNYNKILSQLEYLQKNEIVNLKNFSIQGHPLTNRTPEITNFKKKIQKIRKNNMKFKNKKNLLIFIGASGAAAEFLERGFEAIHISDNEITDIYSNDIYPSLIVSKIKDGIYRYRLKNKSQLINLGDRKININHYFKKLNKGV